MTLHKVVESFRQVVSHDRVREARPKGSGRDNLPGGRPRGHTRMTRRQRTLLIGSAVLLGAILLLWKPASVGPEPAGPVAGAAADLADLAPPTPVPVAIATQPGTVVPSPVVDRREYALGMHELSGLPSDTTPGTRMELWVTWDPPVTKAPKLQRLIRDVVVTEIVPPLTPDGPTAVIVSVPTKRVPDLIWGDRYGNLSVVLPGR